MQHLKMLSRISIPCFQQRIKKCFLSVLVLLLNLTLSIPHCFATLSPGDIVFTGYNSDGNSRFSFIATTNINGREKIFFTDRGFADEKTPPGWNSTEGTIKYVVPNEGLKTGDMVILEKSGSWAVTNGFGSIEDSEGNMDLSTEGDQIFAYQTVDSIFSSNPIFIAGINMNNSQNATESNWDDIDGLTTNSNESDLPDALTNGLNAIWVHSGGEKDNSKYNNTITQGTKSEILASVNNNSNWVLSDDTRFTLGYPATTSTIASSNWNSVSTWNATNGIPGKTTDVTINHTITITDDCASDSTVVAGNAALTINSGKTLTCSDTLTLLSDAANSGSLIIEGTLTGVVTYKRYLAGGKWHLVSAPVSGQGIVSFLTNTENNIPQKETGYGMMDYNTSMNGWNTYFAADTSGNIASGKGYCVRRTSDGTVSFTGAVLNSAVNPSVSGAGSGWNLVGSPYPSAINANTIAHTTNNFLTANSSNLDPSYTALYLWDEQGSYSEGRNDYVVINNAGSGSLVQNYLQCVQGFFVKAISGATSVNYTPEMRTHQTSAGFKSAGVPWPSIVLSACSGELESKTTFLFNEEMTTGLDIGYDAGAFKANADFFIYSKLVEDNGVDFMMQCLPSGFEKTLVVPIGIDVSSFTELEFSLKTNNWPEGIEIVLEDKLTQCFTLFDNSVPSYRATLSERGTGRFYLLIGKNVSTSVDVKHDDISIIPDEKLDKITITGPVQNETFVSVYEITGKTVASYIIHGSFNELDFSKHKSGIYIIHVKGPGHSISKKIKWVR